MRAEGYPTTDVVGFAWDAELTPSSTRSEDDLWSGELFAEVGIHLLRVPLEGDALDVAVVEQVDVVEFGVLAQVSSELCPCGRAYRRDVFDASRLIDLTTDALSDDGDTESLTS